MAPVCVCGHRASEHRKQMRMRTECQVSLPSADLKHIAHCPCAIYRPKEE